MIYSLVIVTMFMLVFIMILYYDCSKDTDYFSDRCNNCGNINESDCLKCNNCGWCVDYNGNGKCIAGNADGPLYKQSCNKWTKTINYNDTDKDYNENNNTDYNTEYDTNYNTNYNNAYNMDYNADYYNTYGYNTFPYQYSLPYQYPSPYYYPWNFNYRNMFGRRHKNNHDINYDTDHRYNRGGTYHSKYNNITPQINSGNNTGTIQGNPRISRTPYKVDASKLTGSGGRVSYKK
jgi:hypothetical protein